jgi:hypothetical protein
MGSFAEIDDNNIVLRVIVAEQDFIDTGLVGDPSNWIQTSYNTKFGIHWDPKTGDPSEDQSKALRKNFAGIGYTYDPVRDAFIPPKPFESWILDEFSCQWKSSIEKPKNTD